MIKPTQTYTDTDNLSSKLGTAQPQLSKYPHIKISINRTTELFNWAFHIGNSAEIRAGSYGWAWYVTVTVHGHKYRDRAGQGQI